MIDGKKTNTNIGVGIGILLHVLAAMLNNMEGKVAQFGLVIGIVGTVFFLWGCFNYAEGKGYSQWLGLLGLLSCIGLLVLVVLPDKE